MSVAAAPSRLAIDPSVFLAPGAVVAGNVSIGADSSVWFHAVLRGDSDRIEIGARTNVQDHTVIHEDEGFPAVIGNDVTIGHAALVHGCRIEDECLIGMGAILLSGARIGTGSLVGAGAVVREGEVVPPGSRVVGVPARVVGSVNDEHRRAIAHGAAHYAELARGYRAAGYARTLDAAAARSGSVPSAEAAWSEIEWDRLLDTLEHGPAEMSRVLARIGPERWTRASSPDQPSAHEMVERMLREDHDLLPLADPFVSRTASASDEGAIDPASRLASWAQTRDAIVEALRRLGPAGASIPQSALLREWVERDLARRRAVRRAAGS